MAIIGTSEGMMIATSAASGTTEPFFCRLVRVVRTTNATTGDQATLRRSSGTTVNLWDDFYDPGNSPMSVESNIAIDLPTGFYVAALDDGIMYLYK